MASGSGLVTLMLASVAPSSFQEEWCVVRGDSHGIARELGRAGRSGEAGQRNAHKAHGWERAWGEHIILPPSRQASPSALDCRPVSSSASVATHVVFRRHPAIQVRPFLLTRSTGIYNILVVHIYSADTLSMRRVHIPLWRAI